MKKIISFIIMLVVLLFSLAACKKAEQEDLIININLQEENVKLKVGETYRINVNVENA